MKKYIITNTGKYAIDLTRETINKIKNNEHDPNSTPAHLLIRSIAILFFKFALATKYDFSEN